MVSFFRVRLFRLGKYMCKYAMEQKTNCLHQLNLKLHIISNNKNNHILLQKEFFFFFRRPDPIFACSWPGRLHEKVGKNSNFRMWVLMWATCKNKKNHKKKITVSFPAASRMPASCRALPPSGKVDPSTTAYCRCSRVRHLRVRVRPGSCRHRRYIRTGPGEG